MAFTTRSLPWDKTSHSRELLLEREWLVTNGLGGFASGTISGAITRRYHGLLIAALPAPLGRMVMWSHVSEFLRFSDDDVISLGGEERDPDVRRRPESEHERNSRDERERLISHYGILSIFHERVDGWSSCWFGRLWPAMAWIVSTIVPDVN